MPVVRANVPPVVLRMAHQGRPAPGPHPKEGEVLDELKQRWKKARFAKDADTATVLGVRFCLTDQGILTDLQYAHKTKPQANQKPPSVIKMLQKGIKKRTDAAKVFRNAKPEPRADLAEKEEREIELLQSLLPKD